MKHTFLIVAVAAQLAAGALMAQTTDSTTAGTTTGTSTTVFGSDWSKTMGTAMMNDDGTAARSADELATQFDTLSDTDKDMLRRDCKLYMQTSGEDEAAIAPDATANTTQTDGATTGNATANVEADGTMGVSMTTEQMKMICAALKDK